MDAAQVADVEGTVATAGLATLAVIAVLRVAAPSAFGAVRAAFAGFGLAMAGTVAVVATAGSLWFSEAAGFPPCVLCWYQRIAMYPLAVLLVVAAVRRDDAVRPYVFAVGGLGLAVSAWHNVVETFPDVDAGGCDPTNPCTIRWVEGLGVWTIPRMAAAAFVLILGILVIDRPRSRPPLEAP